MEFLADPRTPPLSTSKGRKRIQEEIRDAINELSKLSSAEVMDQVYRRYQFLVCSKCHRKLLDDPLGRDSQP
jgi:flagellar basal body-associated protein FliL